MMQVNSLDKISTLAITMLIFTMSSIGFFMIENESTERQQLEAKEMPRFAVSPGHTVFGEYVGAHWCGPCMGSASPSLVNLKTAILMISRTFHSSRAPQAAGLPMDLQIGETTSWPHLVVIQPSLSQTKPQVHATRWVRLVQITTTQTLAQEVVCMLMLVISVWN